MPDITMPQLGETVTEGTITKWFKQVGDRVAEDEPLFEVSTDKVDSEVPSTASGYVVEILVPEGQTVDVGAKLAVIGDQAPDGAGDSGGEGQQQAEVDAEADAGADADADAGADGQAQDEDEAPPAAEEQAEPVAEDSDARPPRAEAEAATVPDERDEDQRGDGQGQRSEPAPRRQQAEREATGPSERTAGRLLSPVVRRLVNEHGLDPDEIPGSGQDGRITRADVLAYIDRNGGRAKGGQGRTEEAPPAAKPERAPAAQAAEAPRARPPGAAPPTAGADDETIPFSNIRRRTAEHMVRSQATSAHVLVAAEVDYSGVERVRQAERGAFKEKEGFSLTYLPFIARAVIDAIEEFPHVNASVGDNELIIHRRVHLGIAVDINFEGLIVPVIHDAEQMRLRALARAISDLARRARSRELNADDISGGTFTITNPGPFGTFLTYPVINQPQVAILSTDGIRKRPVAIELPDGTDAVVVRPVGMLGLSFDHRAFDGAYASAFVGRVKEILETRDWSQEV
jgi:pyruvate dehydrogenase E2 component (dihydrolipoamide acetyltransferase)